MAKNNTSSVFLHSTFRTCSTWWWAKFRELPDVTAYYEPLHPNLLDRTEAQCEASHHDNPKSALFRHPNVDKHYWDEYPLKRNGGVDGYMLRFAFADYAMRPGDIDPEQTAYISSLIQNSNDNNRQAVLKFNRSTLKAGWLKQQFGGTHLHLNRDPQKIADSVRSFMNLGDGKVSNADFAVFFLMIIGQNATHPSFKRAAEKLGLQVIHELSMNFMLGEYQRKAMRMKSQDLNDAIGFVWATGLIHASSYADIIIDQELMNDDPYRGAMQKMISDKSGVDLSLGDFYGSRAKASDFMISEEMSEIIQDAIRFIPYDLDKLSAMPISKSSQEHLMRCLG